MTEISFGHPTTCATYQLKCKMYRAPSCTYSDYLVVLYLAAFIPLNFSAHTKIIYYTHNISTNN